MRHKTCKKVNKKPEMVIQFRAYAEWVDATLKAKEGTYQL